MKEERDSLTEEGVDSQKTLESLLKEIDEDKKWLEKAEQKNNELDSEISEQERLAGKAFKCLPYLVCRRINWDRLRTGEKNFSCFYHLVS